MGLLLLLGCKVKLWWGVDSGTSKFAPGAGAPLAHISRENLPLLYKCGMQLLALLVAF